jgi:hypothetical protein
MADSTHIEILNVGVRVWNEWRESNPHIQPDLYRAHLAEMDLENVNFNNALLIEASLPTARLTGATLVEANATMAIFQDADLSGCDLTGAWLFDTNFVQANLSGANLRNTNLYRANFALADLSCADLSGSNLNLAHFVETNLDQTNLADCSVYGLSAWNLKLNNTKQSGLVISRADEPAITVDDLEVAQFIYLLLNNERIRNVIDTVTSKVVLILGRFTEKRKQVLVTLRTELRNRGYTPILFDFEKPHSRDLTETVSTLAHMARFVIADITEAKSIPQELQAIVPHLPSVPVQPLLLASDYEYGMFEHFKRYPWVLQTYLYRDVDELLGFLSDKVISPAEMKARELQNYD